MQPVRKSAWADNLRVWATFSVIMLHVSMESRTAGFNADLVYGALVRAAVPIFFMLTGALLLGREHSMKDFMRRRMVRLAVPALFWSLVYIAFSLRQKAGWGETMTLSDAMLYTLFSLRRGSYFHLWYIYMIMGIYLFIPFLARAVRNSPPPDLLFFLAMWFIAHLLTIPSLVQFGTNIYLGNFMGFAGYLVLGYYLSLLPPLKNGVWIGLALFITMALATGVGNYLVAQSIHAFPATLLYDYLRPNIILMAVGLFLFARSLPEPSGAKESRAGTVARIRAFISDHSYGIYFVHVLSLMVLDKAGINWQLFDPFIGIPVTSVLCLALSGGVIWALRKLPFGSYWVG